MYIYVYNIEFIYLDFKTKFFNVFSLEILELKNVLKKDNTCNGYLKTC